MRGSKISKLYVVVHSQKNLSSNSLPSEKRDVGSEIEPPQSEFKGGKEGEGKKTMLNAAIGLAAILGVGLVVNSIAALISRGLNVG